MLEEARENVMKILLAGGLQAFLAIPCNQDDRRAEKTQPTTQ